MITSTDAAHNSSTASIYTLTCMCVNVCIIWINQMRHLEISLLTSIKSESVDFWYVSQIGQNQKSTYEGTQRSLTAWYQRRR